MGPASETASEAALQAFLQTLPEAAALHARALAHAWTLAGGSLQVGRMTVRLLANGPNGRSFTAATLHAAHAPNNAPALELSRVLLFNHGLSNGDWTAWSDDLTELQTHGFTATAKYPTIGLSELPDAVGVRLAQGLRDLARLAQGQPA